MNTKPRMSSHDKRITLLIYTKDCSDTEGYKKQTNFWARNALTRHSFKVTFYIFLIIKNAFFLDQFSREIVNLPKEDDCSPQLFVKLALFHFMLMPLNDIRVPRSIFPRDSYTRGLNMENL